MSVYMRALGLLAATSVLAACGSTAYTTSPTSPAPATLSSADGHLTGAGGKAVYLWVKDTGSTSMCTGACATAWPPLTATTPPTVSAPLEQAKVVLSPRPDGTQQVTYAGHPLYYYAGDSASDDTYGQGNSGFGAKWWLVSPAGAAITTMTGSSSGPSGGASPSASSGGGYSY